MEKPKWEYNGDYEVFLKIDGKELARIYYGSNHKRLRYRRAALYVNTGYPKSYDQMQLIANFKDVREAIVAAEEAFGL